MAKVYITNAQLVHFVKDAAGKETLNKTLDGKSIEDARQTPGYSRSQCKVSFTAIGASLTRFEKAEAFVMYQAMLLDSPWVDGFTVRQVAVDPYIVNGKPANKATIMFADGETLQEAVLVAGYKLPKVAAVAADPQGQPANANVPM